ncbi:MAG: ABC transporter ATP-binding protein/permease [Reyranellaceae bacterium]
MAPTPTDAPQSLSWPRFLLRFWHLAGPYWRSPRRGHALLLTALVVVLTVAQVAVAIALNFWNEQFFNALEQKQLGRFLMLIGVFLAIVAANVAVMSLHLHFKRRLQIDWRDWLTAATLDRWMAEGRPYQLGQMQGAHDNPDARIAEDARIATEYAVDLAHSALYANLLLVSFVVVLWQVSGTLTLELGGRTLEVPGHMVWIGFVYSLLGTWFALWLGRPLMQAADRRQSAEAGFRFGLVHALENAVAIALVKGERDERRRFADLFAGAVNAWHRQTSALRNLYLYTVSWPMFSQIFPILIAAPRYIAGSITLGTLMQSAQAFQQMTAALSWPIDNLAKAADWRASVERVHGLRAGLNKLERKVSAPEAHRIAIATSERPVLALHALAIEDPDGSLAIARFSLEIGGGERVLISGETGATTKLFKAVAGIWPWGRGRIELPQGAAIYSMPERPYLPVGTLADTVRYHGVAACTDAAILEALRRVGLSRLAPRLNEIAVWEHELGVSDQQRLGFARLLLHRPDWIFMQEPTDALDAEGEREMMALLQAEFPRATLITISQRLVMRRYHGRHLALQRHDGCAIVKETVLSDT